MTTGDAAYLPFREQFIALAPDKYPPAWIDAQVWAGFWRCWSNGKAAILAKLTVYPSGLREIEGLAAAGELKSIVALIEEAEKWGRDNGCAIASIQSREGWGRLLPEYAVTQVRIEKELG